jgi:hypothetical protein
MCSCLQILGSWNSSLQESEGCPSVANYVLGASEYDKGTMIPVYALLRPITTRNENVLNVIIMIS